MEKNVNTLINISFYVPVVLKDRMPCLNLPFGGAENAGCWDMAAEGLRDAKNSIYGMRIFPVDIMTTLCNTINDYRM